MHQIAILGKEHKTLHWNKTLLQTKYSGKYNLFYDSANIGESISTRHTISYK